VAAYEPENATPVVVGNGPVTGIDGVLQRAGALEGRVTDSDGEPLDFVEITAYRFDGTAWQLAATTYADPLGDYAFDNLVPDTYRLGFTGYLTMGPNNPVMIFIAFHDGATDLAGADDIVVTEGAVVEIDASLGEAGVDGLRWMIPMWNKGLTIRDLAHMTTR